MGNRITPTTSEIETVQDYLAKCHSTIARLRAIAVTACQDHNDAGGVKRSNDFSRLASEQLALAEEAIASWYTVAQAVERRGEWNCGLDDIDERIAQLQELREKRLAMQAERQNNKKITPITKRSERA